MMSKYLSRISLIAFCLTFLTGCSGLTQQEVQATAEAQAKTLIAPTKTLLPTTTPTVPPTATHTVTPNVTPTVTPLPIEITDAKSVTMRLVPAGEFTMGSAMNDDEKPPHKVMLSDFYMDVYEVTNAAYKRCVDADGCIPPTQSDSGTRSVYYGHSEFDEYPVIYVNWNMAKTYCEWRDARLPTEAEWEKAARGPSTGSGDGRTYPWGEDISCDKANYVFCAVDTTKVGVYESGKSPYGMYDMAGNVGEWVSSWYQPYPYDANDGRENLTAPEFFAEKVTRGGSWYSYFIYTRSAFRLWIPPDFTDYGVGIRCARSLP